MGVAPYEIKIAFGCQKKFNRAEYKFHTMVCLLARRRRRIFKFGPGKSEKKTYLQAEERNDEILLRIGYD